LSQADQPSPITLEQKQSSKLFGQILNINPQTEKLKDICRILLDQETPYSKTLEDLAFCESKLEEKTRLAPKEVETLRLGNQESEDFCLGTMSHLREFPQTLKKEFLLPDMIFDRRLTQRELLVHKRQQRERRQSWNELFEQRTKMTPEKKLARQRTYILLDVSASTESRNRLVVEKAIAIAYLESNQKGKGEVFYRPFNHEPGGLRYCKSPCELRSLINGDVMPQPAIGQTNLQLILETALKDLDDPLSDTPAEILLLTDGLAPLELTSLLDMAGQHKIHTVLVGGNLPSSDDLSLRKRFKSIHVDRFRRIANETDPKKREQLREPLNELFNKDREHHQQPSVDELETHLENLSREQTLEALSRETQGLFIHVPDLPEAWTCQDSQIEVIANRISEIEALLSQASSTDLEKEQLVDELLALRNYIDELKGLSNNPKQTQDWKNLKDKIAQITLSSEELQSILNNAKVNWTNHQQTEGTRLGLFRLLRILLGQLFKKK
jgi:hypothetical protein